MNKEKLVLSLTMSLLFLAVIIGGEYAHESAHQRIAENYGCNATIHMKLLKQSHTTIICPENMSHEDLISSEHLHSLNEIESYNQDILVASIYILTLFVILGGGEKHEYNNRH
jgi:hypothetical protein